MSLDTLPLWIPHWYVPNYRRNFGTIGAVVGERAYVQVDRRQRMRLGRLLGHASSRDGFIYVAERWYWYARFELFLQALMHHCIIRLIRRGLLRAPYEGAFFHEHRIDPPGLWGTPIRRHERGYAAKYHW